MPWLLTSSSFLQFLEIEDKLKIYVNPPAAVYNMEGSEFPIIKSIMIRNRQLLIHVTGPKYEEGVLSSVVSKVSWLLLGSTTTTVSANEQRGQILVMKEDDRGTHAYDLKHTIELNDIPTCACWDTCSLTLTVGYASGNIDCFVLSPESNNTKLKLYTTIRGFKKPIIAVTTQGLNRNVLAISKENVMGAFDISHEENYKVDETALNYNLTALHFDTTSNRLFLGTNRGEFYIYSFLVEIY